MRKSSQDDLMRSPDRRGKYIFLARMAVLVVATLALLTYGLSQALPRISGPSTPAPTATPTLAPGPSPSVSLSGRLDATGALTEDVQVVSEDGLAVLKLPRGTKVLAAGGQPPAAITVTAMSVPLRPDAAYVGLAYEFGPEGTVLDPPASLTISYDPRATYPFAYQDIDTSLVYLAYLGKNGPIRPALASEKYVPAGEPMGTGLGSSIDRVILEYLGGKIWVESPNPETGQGGKFSFTLPRERSEEAVAGVADGETASVSGKIDHLGTLVLYCEVFSMPLS
jgi:hypothetical protein